MRVLALTLYYAIAQRLPDSNFPLGERWRRARQWCVRRFIAHAGEHVNVESHVFVADGRYLRLGDGSSLGTWCRVYGAYIGDRVMVAPGVLFLKENHEMGDLDTPMEEQGRTEPTPPVIEDDVWIGERAIILPGRRIGTGAVVGAGAVVSRDVEPYQVVAGNPARPVSSRLTEVANR